MAVNQDGLVRATSSVSLNGSVRLVAQDMGGTPAFTAAVPKRPISDRAGELKLGSGSLTEVLPEIGTATAADAQNQSPSSISLLGRRVQVGAGATVRATGGEIRMQAVTNPNASTLGNVARPGAAAPEILIDNGALVDVSGDRSTLVSVARNFVAVEARGNELADAPLQRDGPIRGQSLVIDTRVGTPFLRLGGAATSIERSAAERLSAGGRISLASEGRVTLAAGAVVDVSGGQVSYSGDTVSTSQLVTAEGRVVDISEADPNVEYAGVLGEYAIDHEKWGVSEVFRSAFSRFEPGYVEGKDAGELRIQAPQISFQAELRASSTSGSNQRVRPVASNGTPAFARPYDQVPLGGLLQLDLLNGDLPDLTIGDADKSPAVEHGHPQPGAAAVVLSSDLLESSGLSRLRLNNAGRIVIDRSLDLPAFGAIDLAGSQVLVLDDISIPGGRFQILRPGLLENAAGLGARALDEASLARVEGHIDVSGRWVNDSDVVNAGLPDAPIVVDGGTIRIGEALREDDSPASASTMSMTAIVLGREARLDVSGGAHLDAEGRFTAGQGGAIALKSGSLDGDLPSTLDIRGELRGFGMRAGASLALQADEFLIRP
ncbi:MAG: hypothetical protein KDK91_25830, partial [Gammaproteobacteria bacterium]|nr:hypothetical protein [Gammaproteobacteria bacterium]